jgi:hypothetical protein
MAAALDSTISSLLTDSKTEVEKQAEFAREVKPVK